MMISPGLVSVTFRHLPAQRVAELAVQAGLSAIEWGGDVHVPHGDLTTARRTARLTREAGLEVAAYGSYYRLGHSAGEGLAAETVVRTAVELGAPVLRVWAGRLASAHSDEMQWRRVVADAQQLADLAHGAGVTVAFEYHHGTLTDTRRSATRLLERVTAPNAATLWQPEPTRSCAENAEDLRAVLPRLANLHVFAWTQDRRRLPFEAGRDAWARYLSVAASAAGERYALLEFVRGDDPNQMVADAQSLRELLSSLYCHS